MEQFHLFDINIVSLNLFSFVLGMVWAFFNQGFFGRRIALPIFLYFAGLAAWYGLQYNAVTHSTKKVKEPTEQTETEPKKEVVGVNGVRWLVSDTLPEDWGITQEVLDKLFGKLKTTQGKNDD